LHGHWDESAACLGRSTEVYAELGGRTGVLPWQRLAELAVERGDSAAVAGFLRRGMAIAAVTSLAPHAWGRLYATAAFDAVERGDPAEAARAVRSAAAATERYGGCPTCSALLNPMAAEAFAALGDRAQAQQFAQAAAQVAGQGHSTAWRAMAESASGSVAMADADRGRAHDHFMAAASLFDEARQPFWAARSRWQAAVVAADPELMADAAATFERLGALRALARIRAS
jgi:hypothetical protein